MGDVLVKAWEIGKFYLQMLPYCLDVGRRIDLYVFVISVDTCGLEFLVGSLID